MHGWRVRIGIIVSPPNTVAEVEFNRMAPEGVSIHASRMSRLSGRKGVDWENLRSTNASLPQAAAAIAPLKPNVLVFAHTLRSMVQGHGHDDELAGMLGAAAGCPAITTAGAVLSAFLELRDPTNSPRGPLPASQYTRTAASSSLAPLHAS